MLGKRVPNCVRKESEEHVDEDLRAGWTKGTKMDWGGGGLDRYNTKDEQVALSG